MTLRKPGIVIAAALLAVLVFLWAGQTNSSDKNPAGGQPRGSEALGPASPAGARLYTVTLKRQPAGKELNDLAARGSWLGTLAEDRVLVQGDEAFRSYLTGRPFVQEVAEYTAEEKLQGAGLEKDSPVRAGQPPVKVILTVVSPGDRGRVAEEVLRLGGKVIDGAGGEGNALLAEVPRGRLTELAESPWIIYLEEHIQPSLLNDRVRDLTGSRPLAVPGFVTSAGLTGKGQSIGLADSGLDRGTLDNIHPDLRDNPGGSPKVIMLKSWVGADTTADTVGHGTHMAATLVGSGAASGGKFAGLAPDASLFFQGIVDQRGQVLPPVNIADLFRPAHAIGARIHVNGWGRPGNRYGTVSAQVDGFIRDNPGFVAIFGAGNDGPQSGSLTLEANSKNALVAGSSPVPGPAFNGGAPDLAAPVEFSSRGPAGDGRIKPDLLAPGDAVISAASGLLEGNLPDLPQYTMLQGTSMSSAVLGGAAAQLRQYLAESKSLAAPSAALVKALLINGARAGSEGPGRDGFGVLDLGGTVLSLEGRSMTFEDHKSGLQTGRAATWKYEVGSSDEPLKATLAWTDPAALPGAGKALVNDLDLKVTAPDGSIYFGNHFLNGGGPDTVNNVEQVFIAHPAPGEYTITVTAKTVTRNASAAGGPAQDFALAFGQPVSGVAAAGKDTSRNTVQLEDGREISLAGRPVKTVIDNRAGRPGLADIHPGSRVYLTPQGSAYFVSRQWQARGVKARQTTGGLLFTGAGAAGAGGGHLAAPGAGRNIRINGVPYPEAGPFPPGGEIAAWVDPLTQNIWQASVSYEVIEGFVAEYKDQAVKLINDSKWRELAPDAAIIFEDTPVHTDPADAAFAPGIPGEFNSLVPGVEVKLVAGPGSGPVQAIILAREVVFNQVERVEGSRIFVSGGKELRLFPGAAIKKDFQEAAWADILPGDHIAGILLPDTGSIIALWAYTDIVYGNISYYSAGDDHLYLNTPGGAPRIIKLGPETKIRRWGAEADKKALSAGVWARVVMAAGEEFPRQVDLAETLTGERETLARYDPGAKTIITAGGGEYSVGKLAVITRAGYPILPEDLLPGEAVSISSILGPQPASRAVTGLTARENGGPRPALTVSALWQENSCWITGHTTGARLYLWEGSRLAKKVSLAPDGRFALEYRPDGSGAPVALVAAGDSGSVAGVNLELRGMTSGPELRDIGAHWAGPDLRAMAQEGLVAGFPGGVFRPGQPVTRAEFTVFLARAFGWYGAAADGPKFKDEGQIPAWAGQSIAGASARGIVAGYPDGSFRPGAPLTREEQCVILDRVSREFNLDTGEQGPAPFADRAAIAPWALAGADSAYHLGIMVGKDGNLFRPDSRSTRAETAVAVYRLLNLVRRH